jgi:hypothetical protein
MKFMKNGVLLLLGALLFSGCAEVTNLTASKQPRNKNGFYLVEATFTSNRQTLIPNTIKPKVVSGSDEIPMEPTPLVQNRWQAYVPANRDQPYVLYHYQFDFQYYATPEPQLDSVLSPEYKLSFTDK